MINSAYIAEIAPAQYYPFTGFAKRGLKALGLSRAEPSHVFYRLLCARMLPPLGNQWIISIKTPRCFVFIRSRKTGPVRASTCVAACGKSGRVAVFWPDHCAGVELYFCVVLKKVENPV